MLNRIRYRILLVVGIATTMGLIATIAFFSWHQERTLLKQNEASVRKLNEAVSAGLHSVMLAGSADIAQAFADRIKKVPEIIQFRIMRTDGFEAFRDNKTIDEVNLRRGEEQFSRRDDEQAIQVMKPDDPDLRRAVDSGEPVIAYGEDDTGNRKLILLTPLVNKTACYKCHGKARPVRGMLRLDTSLAAVERDILKSRHESVALLAIALLATVLATGYMLGRIVVRPIEKVTYAMARISGGDLAYKVAERSGDEIGRMGESFNQMVAELQQTDRSFRREHDKLTTVIETATEGIIVTDATGSVVLVNPAAVKLLGRSAEEIVAAGFFEVVEDRGFIEDCLRSGTPRDIDFRQRSLEIHASIIRTGAGQVVGSVALVRDVTEARSLQDELHRMATTDALTGLYNRRFLDATLHTEYIRAVRSRSPLAVIMFDIDHFKRFNDVHGHELGDRVLQMVSRCFRSLVRPFDFPCRYGGEEFVAILPGMSAEDAVKLAEALRLKVAQTEIGGLNVHISLGVAGYPAIHVAASDDLIAAADAALYRAKEGGRNRVVLAGAAS